MNKLLAYGLWMLLSFPVASTLWCHDCEKLSEKDKCPKQQDVCQAAEGESCYIQNLYIKNHLMFSRVGCFKDCRYFKKPASFLWYVFTCCNKDYCNE